jgi:hypothetical protein
MVNEYNLTKIKEHEKIKEFNRREAITNSEEVIVSSEEFKKDLMKKKQLEIENRMKLKREL